MGSAVAKSAKGRPASLAQCRRVLGDLPVLDDLDNDDLSELTKLLRVRDFVAGSTIFYEDDESDAVYFIERGAVEIFKSDGSGRKLPLAVLRDSGVIGEVGLLLSSPRTASVRTLTAVRTLVMSSEGVHQALESGSLATFRLALAFARVLAERLAIVDKQLFELCDKTNDDAQLHQYADLNQNLLHMGSDYANS